MKNLRGITFFILLINCLQLVAQQQATEVRAVWLTTNWGLDWPKYGKTAKSQKQELINILDELSALNFNLILFQARGHGRVFYNSNIESKSTLFDNSFDPLAFVLEESHKRNMECHAWITMFPDKKNPRRNTKTPEHIKIVNNYWYLDPGHPTTHKYLQSIVSEIVDNYDIDGIHLDYIRYPDKPKDIKDDDTFRVFGRSQQKEDWRRDNVTKLVYSIYDLIKAKKPWVQLSSAPIGKYTSLPNKKEWTAYETLSQDPIKWINDGKHDLLFPMLYYEINEFTPHYEIWREHNIKRPIVAGLGLYKLDPKDKNWDLDVIKDAVKQVKSAENNGFSYFRTSQIIDNTKGVKDYLKELYQTPAKLPELLWLSQKYPNDVKNLHTTIIEKGKVKITWEAPDFEDKYTYHVYVSDKAAFNPKEAKNLVATHLNKPEITIDYETGEYGKYYFITTSNSFHLESKKPESIFFVHSQYIY